MNRGLASRSARRPLFDINVWPPLTDALTLVLASFVLVVILGAVAQRAVVARLRASERALAHERDERARIERRLAAVAGSTLEVSGDRVILQGEILFDSGSDALRPSGRAALERMAGPLGALLTAEPGHMVLVGGHTDDRPIKNERFASNWALATARAVAVAHVLVEAGLPPSQVVPAGFGEHHPRAAGHDEAARRRNRRIEVQVVPIRSVGT